MAFLKTRLIEAMRPSRMFMKRSRIGGLIRRLIRSSTSTLRSMPYLELGDGCTQTFPFLLMEKSSAPQLSML
jgi:hypothetical protein